MTDNEQRKADLALVNSLTPSQQGEAIALRDGMWGGDPEEVSGLRALGIQDNGLGVTELGRRICELLETDWREHDRLGIRLRRGTR